VRELPCYIRHKLSDDLSLAVFWISSFARPLAASRQNPNTFGTFLRFVEDPAYGLPFLNISQRGIDPHVDDPNHCHNHSEVPENDQDWPTLEAITEFRDRVRQRLLALYDDLSSGKQSLTRNIARMLVMAHEHEGFHVEVGVVFSDRPFLHLTELSMIDHLVYAHSKRRIWRAPSTRLHASPMDYPCFNMGNHPIPSINHCVHPIHNGYSWPG